MKTFTWFLDVYCHIDYMIIGGLNENDKSQIIS